MTAGKGALERLPFRLENLKPTLLQIAKHRPSAPYQSSAIYEPNNATSDINTNISPNGSHQGCKGKPLENKATHPQNATKITVESTKRWCHSRSLLLAFSTTSANSSSVSGGSELSSNMLIDEAVSAATSFPIRQRKHVQSRCRSPDDARRRTITPGTCRGLPPPRPVVTAMYCLPPTVNDTGKPCTDVARRVCQSILPVFDVDGSEHAVQIADERDAAGRR